MTHALATLEAREALIRWRPVLAYRATCACGRVGPWYTDRDTALRLFYCHVRAAERRLTAGRILESA